MPKTRDYEISIHSALKGDGFVSMALMLREREGQLPQSVRVRVQASTFDQLDAEIDRVVAEHEPHLGEYKDHSERGGVHGFAVSVSVPRGDRKPNGFDARYDRLPFRVRKAEVAAEATV